MLVISSEKMHKLERAMQEAFVDRLVVEVKEHYAEVFGDMPRDALHLLVESALEKAHAFGFEFESSLASFAHLMFAVAPNFYLHPAVRAVLTDPALPLEQRVSLLPERIPPAVWDEIVRSYDASAW